MAFAKESLKINRELENASGIAVNLMSLVRLTIWSGNLSSVIPWLEEARSIYRQIGDMVGEADVLTAYGHLAYWQGDYQQAREYYEEGISLNEKIGNQYDNLWIQIFLAYATLRQENVQQARRLFRGCIQNLRKADMVIGLVFTIEGLASLNVHQGQFKKAVQLFSWTDGMREKLGDQRPPVEQNSVEKDLAIIHSKLKEEDFAKLYAEGQAMSTEQAIALALQEL